MSEEHGSQRQTGIHTNLERTVHQQLDALLPALLTSEIQASLHIARTDWIAVLESKVAQLTEMRAPRITNRLLSDSHVFIEKRIFGQF